MTVAVADPVTAYAEGAVAGRLVVSRWVRLAAERHLRDLEWAREMGWRWEPRELERFERFCSHLPQSKGTWGGRGLELLPWQQFVLGQALGWKRADGMRRFRRVYVEVGKKNGKTTLASALAIWLLDFDGEPGAEVYVAAVDRKQARLCWDEAAWMIQRTPSLARRVHVVESTASAFVRETHSRLVALGADTDSMDGLNSHGVIIDELARHRTRAVLDRLETSGAARRQPLLLYVTTAPLPDEAGRPAYEDIRGYSERVLQGLVQDDEWLAFVAAIDEGDHWTDESCWPKANPSLGVTLSWEFLRAAAQRARESEWQRLPFRTLHLNERLTGAAGWLELTEWDACADRSLTLEAFRGRPVYAGLDLAATRDTTALVLVTRDDDGRWLIWEEIWVPRDTVLERSRSEGLPYRAWVEDGWVHETPGAVTDYGAIRARIRELVDDYGIDIRELAYDRWNATQLVHELAADGLTCVAAGMGYQTMTMPMREVERAVAQRSLVHRGSPAMRWQMASMAVKSDPAGNTKPDRERATGRIDAVVAMLIGLDRAVRHVAERRTSVYEGRGLSWL